MKMTTGLSDRYSPIDVEKNIYNFWMENSYFSSENRSTKPPYSITLPPPNVTSHLHIGHALDFAIQDVLIRWKRMSGFNAMWMPGADHAGIATQTVVEKQIWKEEKRSRFDVGRKAFLEKVWKWKEKYGDQIVEQSKAMGFSLDWDRMRFTLDEKSNHAVLQVFVKLYKEGLIYQGTKLVNWSPKLQSAISDLEVDHQEQKASIWHIKYPLKNSNEYVVVATTRPETLLGDTAVAVNPEDERYKHLIGKEVKLPLTERCIKVIADEYVDKDFGSGVVKITPAHDFNDYEVGKRHQLEVLNILNPDATLNEQTGNYQGLNTIEARKRLLTDLEEQGLIEKVEDHTLKTPLCSRTGCVVEPYLSKQWFVKIESLAKPAKNVVESGTVSFEPESWTKVYLHWMNNIEDWCISRQLWWGHRIPVFYCKDCNHCDASVEAITECGSCKSTNIYQDEDVLDTWFSSSLWPFSTLGWPEDTEALKTFYPNDCLVTGPDIIFFWVARMIMMGLHFQRDVPFRKVYLHGIVRDSQGRKMSKSLGNGIDPQEVVKKEGADALRYTLFTQIQGGKDLKFSTQRLETYRNFMNKIWNAARFSLSCIEGLDCQTDLPNSQQLNSADKWILFKLKECIDKVNIALTDYRFSEAAFALYQFTWNHLCDWYLEFIKPIVYGENTPEKQATQRVLVESLSSCIRLLHPFIPFITEEIYQKLPNKKDACIIDQYPNLKNSSNLLSLADEKTAQELDIVKDTISAIRNIRGENRIKQAEKILCYLQPSSTYLQSLLAENKDFILRLAGLSECHIIEEIDKQKCAVSLLTIDNGNIEVVIPLSGLVDFAEEIKRIQKSIDKNNKEIEGLQRKLSNDRFISNAPKEVVEADKNRLQQLKTGQTALEQSLARLS